jgi:SP family myo-inositol transporter-like MFS transporter 13
MAFSSSITELMIGRVLVGLAIGIASMVVPVYLSEVAPLVVRGKVVAVFVVTITLGQLIAACLALALGRNWRLMLGIAAIPAFIQLILMFFMPES